MADIDDFYRGDTRVYKFVFTDSAGSAIDITGWHIWFTLKTDKTAADTAAALQVDHTVGDNVSDDAVAGTVYVTATSDDTAITVGTYYYDFQRVIPGTPPDVKTILAGKVKVLQDVTADDT
jgi:hypothetical protein